MLTKTNCNHKQCYHQTFWNNVLYGATTCFCCEGESGSHVCWLHRGHSMYGLTRSPRAWYGKLSTIIQEFASLIVELITFYFINILHEIWVFIWLFTLMISLSPAMIKMILLIWINIYFSISRLDLSRLKYFPGIDVTQSRSCIFISAHVCLRHSLRDKNGGR